MSSFQIRTNIGALKAYNALAKVNKQTADAQLRLATQKRINSVADDTSGYNVGKSLEGRVSVMKAAQGNISAAKDMLSTAETSLQNINDLLNQIKAKITDANDPTKDKSSLAADIEALGKEIENIFSTTEFNGTALLTGVSTGDFKFQTGHDSGDELILGFTEKLASVDVSDITSVTSANIGGSAGTTLRGTVEGIETSVKNALGSIGNDVQRLDVKDNYLTAAITNANSSISRLFDADMAMEQLNATKGSISAQASTAMLAQLNMAPQNILSLFQ
jgi:flagellin